MSVILILMLASLATALLFLGGFIWAVRSGQYEDTLTPSMRVLTEETARSASRPGGHINREQCNAGRAAAPHPGLQPSENRGAANTEKY